MRLIDADALMRDDYCCYGVDEEGEVKWRDVALIGEVIRWKY